METISEKDFDALEGKAEHAQVGYTHKFRKPFTYKGKTFENLTFDFDGLTGRDGMNIKAEIRQTLGVNIGSPTWSDEYQVRMCAKACNEKIGADAFELMPLFDHNKILDRARTFLARSEL